MKTIEINVGKLGGEIHESVRFMTLLSPYDFQYSAGGDPYVIRLVVMDEAVSHFTKQMDQKGIKYSLLEGSRSF